MEKVKKRKIFENLDLTIAALMLGVLVVMTMVGVFFRYFINRPIPWIEEVQTSLIIWVIFLAGSAAFRRGEHMSMEFVYDKLSPAGKKVLDVVIYLVNMLAIIYLGIMAWNLINLYSKTNRMTSILHIPAPYIYIIIPVGCVLMLMSETIYFWNKLHGRVHLNEIEQMLQESKEQEENP